MSALSLQHNKRLEELIEKHKEELKKLEGLKDEEMKVHAGLFQVLNQGVEWFIFYFKPKFNMFMRCVNVTERQLESKVRFEVFPFKIMICEILFKVQANCLKFVQESGSPFAVLFNPLCHNISRHVLITVQFSLHFPW